MSEHHANVAWARGDAPFGGLKYNRKHTWAFDGGIEIPASASPLVVRPPYSDPAAVDPEEALVAAVSSCHMLTFLYLAAKAGYSVDVYTDDAVGILGVKETGRKAILAVKLKPVIVWTPGQQPTADQITALHEAAHKECYIANSVAFPIHVG
jgi:organic hydroperoxide reductase OsmC/OhrA